MPTATMMALLVNPTNPALAESTTREVQAAARTLGLKLHILRASAESDFDTVFATMLQLKATALEIAIDLFFTARREQLAELARPAPGARDLSVSRLRAAGGVMSYGGSLTEGYRLVGLYT